MGGKSTKTQVIAARLPNEFADRLPVIAEDEKESVGTVVAAMLVWWMTDRERRCGGVHAKSNEDGRCLKCGSSRAWRREQPDAKPEPTPEPEPMPEPIGDRTFEQAPPVEIEDESQAVPVEEEDVSQVVPMRF
jgi:hypothetical protein